MSNSLVKYIKIYLFLLLATTVTVINVVIVVISIVFSIVIGSCNSLQMPILIIGGNGAFITFPMQFSTLRSHFK